jgi:hypothetical protein
MTGNIHRVLVTIASAAAAIGAFVLSADKVPFGMDAYDIGLTLVWIGSIANIVATVIRANWIPGVTTGTGNE